MSKLGSTSTNLGALVTSWMIAATSIFLLGLVVSGPEPAWAAPPESVQADEVAQLGWGGSAPNQQLSLTQGIGSGVKSAGDVNQDGQADLLALQDQRLYVLFGRNSSNVSVGSMSAAQGYVIKAPGTIASFSEVGDQNGDGIPDQLLGLSDSDEAMLVYGIQDPSSLGTCGSTTKCLDATTLSTTQGYVITSTAAQSEGNATFGANVTDIGDFNSDGVNDFAVGDYLGTDSMAGAIYVVFGDASRSLSTLDVDGAAPADVLTITGTDAMSLLGFLTSGVGDVNDDGVDDLYANAPALFGGPSAASFVIFGGSDVPNPLSLSSLTGEQGVQFSPGAGLLVQAQNGGDVDGDGIADMLIGATGLFSPDGFGSVLYGRSDWSGAATSMLFPALAQGYALTTDESGNGFGNSTADIGDLNNDGVPDQVYGAPSSSVGNGTNSGLVDLLFGQRPAASNEITVGPGMANDIGLALAGDSPGAKLGSGVAPMGDVDADGLPDFAVSAPFGSAFGQGQAGAIYIVRGSSLVAQAKTGKASGVTDKTASLNGVVSSNRRDVEAKFEYGTSTDYGSESSPQAIAGSGSSDSADADLTGLDPETIYHYRLVVTNDLGLTRYGGDRTFTTGATLPSQGCEADNTKPGCPGYKYCEDSTHAGEAACQTPVARLSGLIVSTLTAKVKRGKKTVVRVTVVNTGGAAASGLRVCASGPKKLVKVSKPCVTVGQLTAGATKTAKFKVLVKKRAKRGKKAVIKLTASATGLDKRSAKTKLKVK